MAFKMNRPIILGTPLQKNTGNNPNDLRRNIGGNTLGLKDATELNEWYSSNMDKENFGYLTFEDFKKDWPSAVMQDGYALTFEGGPDYIQPKPKPKPKPKPPKPKPRPIEKVISIEKKDIEMLPTTKTPDVVKPSKRKYITSKDRKWKYNLETGEKTRVKTQKVKKSRKPGKRSVRNLVTGRTNRVQ